MIARLIFRNLVFKPYITVLSLILLCLGSGIISVLLLIEHQVRNKFSTDLKDIDMVVGAKGSPLQLVLSAVYHVDAPTGNIQMSEVEEILKNPMIQQAIPLAYGDSYKGFRILGADSLYLKKYGATFYEGFLFKKSMEAIAGNAVAKKLRLKIGDRFTGNHGLSEHGEVHEEHAYQVVGVLNFTGTVIDNLILTDVQSVRDIHTESHQENHHDEESKKSDDHNFREEHGENDDPKKEITALLIKLKSPVGLLSLPRAINENTKLQAALPVLEINRLGKMMGIGISTMKYLAAAIIMVSCLSMFISLYIRMKDREFEIALLRTFGYSRLILFLVPVFECIILSIAGFIAGILFSRFVLKLINREAESGFHWSFNTKEILPNEWVLLIVILIAGILSAIIPAAKVFRLNPAKILSND